jgi:excisionase family DNA binding protein
MYSVKEAAAKLGVTDRHVRLLLAAGEISGRKLGHDWVVLSLEYERKRKPKTKKRRVAGNELGQKPDEVWMEGSL